MGVAGRNGPPSGGPRVDGRCVQVDHWLEFSARRLRDQAGVSEALAELDKALSLRTFLVGHALTLADISVWASLKGALCGLLW